MTTKTLLIDSTNAERFFLAVQSGVLQIGPDTAHAEGTVQNLRVVRVRCEVEVDDDRDNLPIDQAGVITPQVLRPGLAVDLKCARMCLQAPAGSSSAATAAPVAAPAPAEPSAAPSVGPRRLKVTDGGDQGRAFALPDEGTVSVGRVGSAQVGLNDLYVAKVHCTLAVESGAVRVTHVEGSSGTLIDNQRIAQPQTLKPGSVLRVGNSHLRLEVGPFPDDITEPLATVKKESRPKWEVVGDESNAGSAPPASAKKDGSGLSRAIPKDGSGVMRPTPPAPKSGTHKVDDAFIEMVGQTIGHYHTDRVLGRGHSGAVFRATDTKTGQVVALKVLAPEFPATQEEIERFTQGLRTAQPVRHPNLIGLLGAGKTLTHCWIAREFVEGESAAAVIGRLAEGEKPSWTRAARVVVHLARALEHLHQHRLVHGNITPRNVLLQAADNATKLTDLRLAEILAGSQLFQKVREKKYLAELPYLAPEQVAAGGFVDSLADLYAVGALAYALCTGQPPVTGKSPAEVREHILHGRVSKPSLVYKKVPPAFDAIVLKLTARNQEDRYQTAAAVLKDLAPIAESHDLKL